jgi:hypothetical protein
MVLERVKEEMMKANVWFDSNLSLAEGKALYRKLLLANHPDHGGSEEVCTLIIASFEAFCKLKMQFAFNEMGDEKTGDANANVFAEILAKVINFNCRIEIIGYWIYAFESYEVKDALKALGFFFSGKHKAWIYAGGGKKTRYHTTNTTQDNRIIHGCTVVRDREERSRISA